MNKNKRKDEMFAQEVDRAIARWDPKDEDFVELVLRDIERSEWKKDEAETVVGALIALLSGDLDRDSKVRILCACDKSAGSSWEFAYHSDHLEKQTIHRPIPIDKLLRVFGSELVPYEWKYSTLLKSMSGERAYERRYGIPWIPTQFDDLRKDMPKAFRLISEFDFHRPTDAGFDELLQKLRDAEAEEPGSVSRLVDSYGNNAHIYSFCSYWSTNDVNGRECGEYWHYGVAMSDALTAMGCDPNRENVFGIARRDLRYGTGYRNFGLVVL